MSWDGPSLCKIPGPDPGIVSTLAGSHRMSRDGPSAHRVRTLDVGIRVATISRIK